MLQTAQRIGLAIGQAVIGATFFTAVGHGNYAHALRLGVAAALGFVLVSGVVSVVDLRRVRSAAPD